MGLFLRTYFEEAASTEMKFIVNTDALLRAAHDLRSPLSAMNLTVHHFKKLSPHLEHLELLDETVRRINNIAEEILSMKQKRKSGPDTFELISTLQYLANESQFQLQNKIEVLGTDSMTLVPLQVRGNADDFTRIFWNLIQNSIEAGAKQVVLDFVEDGKVVHLMLKDNGRGIPKEFLNKIGQEGFTTKNKGNGVGIYSAIQKLHSWNGDLKISTLPSEGTCIIVSLIIA